MTDAKTNSTDAIDKIRTQSALVVSWVFKLFALVLVIAAVLVLLGKNVNADNGVVSFFRDFAGGIDGPFSKDNGIFDFSGKHGEQLDALTNWGLGAVVYSVVGSVLAKLIRP